jgi:hypothetical protein
MSRAVPLEDQISVLERLIMDANYNGDDMAALGATLRVLKLFKQFEAPARAFFKHLMAEIASVKNDPVTQMVLADWGDGLTFHIPVKGEELRQ